jgi:hypothetical protein
MPERVVVPRLPVTVVVVCEFSSAEQHRPLQRHRLLMIPQPATTMPTPVQTRTADLRLQFAQMLNLKPMDGWEAGYPHLSQLQREVQVQQ